MNIMAYILAMHGNTQFSIHLSIEGSLPSPINYIVIYSLVAMGDGEIELSIQN